VVSRKVQLEDATADEELEVGHRHSWKVDN